MFTNSFYFYINIRFSSNAEKVFYKQRSFMIYCTREYIGHAGGRMRQQENSNFSYEQWRMDGIQSNNMGRRYLK